jgi:pyruvate-formate lyase-activating enzyme
MIKRAHWNILTECNLSCGFCYLWRRPEARIWTTAEAVKLIDSLAANVGELVFGGGDPLMRQDILDIIVRSKGLGLRVELHTNAVMVESVDCAPVFGELDRLGVSLDGDDESTHDRMRSAPGNFRQTLRALDLAERLGLPTTVRTLCTRRNSNDIRGIGRLLETYSCVDRSKKPATQAAAWVANSRVPLSRVCQCSLQDRLELRLVDSVFFDLHFFGIQCEESHGLHSGMDERAGPIIPEATARSGCVVEFQPEPASRMRERQDPHRDCLDGYSSRSPRELGCRRPAQCN